MDTIDAACRVYLKSTSACRAFHMSIRPVLTGQRLFIQRLHGLGSAASGDVKVGRAPWDRRKMQKFVANNLLCSQDGDVTASLWRLGRFYRVTVAYHRVHA